MNKSNPDLAWPSVITASNVIFGLAALAAVAASVLAVSGAQGLFGAALAAIALGIAAVDLRRFLIPDFLVAAGLALGLLYAATLGEQPLSATIAAALRGAFVASLFFLLRAGYRRLRRREGIGLGDVKLAAMAGTWLALDVVPLAIALAALTALAVVAVRHWVLGRSMTVASRVPFGFFFAPAIWLGWLVEATLLSPW